MRVILQKSPSRSRNLQLRPTPRVSLDCRLYFRFLDGSFWKSVTDASPGRPTAAGRPGSLHCSYRRCTVSTVPRNSSRALSARECVLL